MNRPDEPRNGVLVVEDDDAIRRLLAQYLAEHAYFCVDVARDGVEALHRMSMQEYGVVILDMVMPKMTGVDVLHSLKAAKTNPGLTKIRVVPTVIVVTSMSDAEVPEAMLHESFAGIVSRVMRKPIDLDELSATIARHLH